jgi:hypothetical protein
MAYCTPSDVASLNKARAIGQGDNPTLQDLQGYILMSAGEIDAILINKGYSVRVKTASWPEAATLLNGVNARGALALMEEASPSSTILDRSQAVWEAAKKMLSDAKTVLNADMDVQRSEPRGPWVTFEPTGETFDPMFRSRDWGGTNSARNPYFSRQQQF